jgi:LUD domain
LHATFYKEGKSNFMATLVPNQEFTQLASEEQITKTVLALEANNIRTVVTQTSEEARMRVLDLIPSGVEVYNSPSRTLELLGLAEDIEHATRFQSVRARLHSLDRVTQRDEVRRMMASPDVLVGSVQAITEQGQVMVASALGSQLAPAAAGAGTVIWVVGTQKLVRTLDDGFRRIREYSYPLEDVRTHQVYGQGSAINKILLVNGEAQPGRITIVLVKQNLGF